MSSATRILSRYPWHCRTCRKSHGEQSHGWYEGARPKGARMQCDACHGGGGQPTTQEPTHYYAERVIPPRECQGTTRYVERVLSNGTTSRERAGVLAWIDSALSRAVNPANERYRETMASMKGRKAFARCSVPDIRRRVLAPDEQTLRFCSDLAEEILGDLPIPLRKRRRTVRAEAGSGLDLGAALAGEPLCWREQERRPAPAITSLAVNMIVSACVDAEALRWRGVALCALACWLQRRGVPVRIVAFQANANSRGWGELFPKRAGAFVIHQTLSAPETPLDLASVAELLAHKDSAGTFRSLEFAAVASESPDRIDEGMGACRTLLPEEQRELGWHYVVPAQVLSKDACREWVRRAADLVARGDFAAVGKAPESWLADE